MYCVPLVHFSFLAWCRSLSKGLGPPPNICMFPPEGADLWGEECELLTECAGELDRFGEESKGPGHAEGENKEYAWGAGGPCWSG